jgi:hypothetical protein
MGMGTFAETALDDFRLSISDQRKHFHFQLPFAANKRKFAISIFHSLFRILYMYLCIHMYIYVYIYIYLYIYTYTLDMYKSVDIYIHAAV